MTVLEAHEIEVRGRWLSGLWHRAIHIEELRLGSLQAAYGAGGAKLLPPGSPLAPPPPLETATNSPSVVRVEIDRVNVARADVAWGSDAGAAGAILGTRAETVTEGAGALRVTLTGGSFHQSGWPVLSLETAKARFARPVLRLEEAIVRLAPGARPAGDRDKDDKDDEADGASDEKPDDGRITLAGEARFERETPLQVRLRFARCPVSPLLPDAWCKRLLGGRFDGSATVDRNLRDEKAPTKMKGTIDARAATLHGLRMLKQIALITGREEFGRLRLRQVRGEFVDDGKKLTVRRFSVEAGREKLLRVEGDFEIEDGKIRGDFEVGVTPGAIAKIPGARERVFTREQEGYVWAHLNVSGPVTHPREDLQARLVAAAKAEIAGKILGSLLGPGKDVLKLLEALEDTIE